MKKRLIEWDLPLKDISEESAREKSIRQGHPSTLHIWWARRPLASSRATNFAALIDLPEESIKRKEFIEVIKKILPWESIKDGNDKSIIRAKEIIENQWKECNPKILDPFSGGGSIPLEALRLGCSTYANDYNPIAVFIEKAILEWPQKFNVKIPSPIKNKGVDGKIREINVLTFMVNKWAKIIESRVKNEIEKYYKNESDGSIPVGYVWVKTIPCQNPNCNGEIPLIRQYWLSKNEDKNVMYRPIVDTKNKSILFEIIEEEKVGFNPDDGTVSRANAKCLICNQVTKAEMVHNLARNGKMGQRLIVVVSYNTSGRGKSYRIATNDDINNFNSAEKYLESKIRKWPWLENPIPDEKMPPIGTYGIDAQRYTVKQEWGELFNSRQKLTLITFVEKIRMVHEEVLEDCKKLELDKRGIDPLEFTNAVIGYLAIGLDRLVDFGSTLCVLNATGGRGVVHTFGRQALPMCWDYFESNPFNPEAAGWATVCEKNEKGIEHATNTSCNSAIITNNSATELPYPDNYFDAIFTDPPYYDNVPYSDLSDFFYVWLKRCIAEYFPDLFSTPLSPKNKEAIAEPMRQDDSKIFFEKMMYKSFGEMYRVLKKDGIATIVYAHKTTDAWETMLNSLIDSGFVVTASWPIHTERTGRLRSQESAALSSSIYMVCRKAEQKPEGFYSEIQPLIKKRIEEKLQQFWSEGISGGDFFISAIGPGMEIYSQYKQIEKLTGEKVCTAELLDYIRSVSTNFIVGKLLMNESSTSLDSESDFYLAFRWTYQDNTVEYDEARKLANASGINLEELWGQESFIHKDGSYIKVLGPKERVQINEPKNMVDAMHKSVLLWEQGKKEEISKLLTKTGYGNNPAFKQFCQAVAESLINGNKEKQLLEGFLLGIDDYNRNVTTPKKYQTDLKQYGAR